jgi:DnaJ-class molecular chaperone
MTTELHCPGCFGTGQKVEMHRVIVGKKLPPYQVCPRCNGTGSVPATQQPTDDRQPEASAEVTARAAEASPGPARR